MKAVDLRAKSAEELAKHLQDLQQKQFKLRMQKATGQLAKTHELVEVRRGIARAKTVLEQKGN
ncbi:MAG: 50S ribosomal protein L29 [Pseudomonadota bacterium]